MSPPFVRAAVLAALTGAACAASAADWQYRTATAAGEPLTISDVVAEGSGYVAIGSDAQQREWWLRVGADASAVARATGRTAYPPFSAGGDGRVAGTGDGVLGAAEGPGRSCMPSLYAGDGQVRWTAAAQPGLECPSLFTLSAQRDARQALWVLNNPSGPGSANGHDYRIGADGQLRPLQPLTGATDWYEYAPIATAAAAYALYSDANGTGLGRVSPSRVEWTRPADADTVLHEVQSTADGDALTGGFVVTEDGETRVVIARHAPDGTVRWKKILADVGGDAMSLRVIAGDRLVVGTRALADPSSNRIIAFAGNGAELWRVPLGAVRFGGFLRYASTDPRNAPPTTTFFAGVGGALDRIVGLSSGGLQIYTRPARGARGAAVLADGSLVNLEASSESGLDSFELKHFSSGGSPRAVPDPDIALPHQYSLHGSLVTADGASVIVEQDYNDRRPRLSEIAPDGRLRWSVRLPATAAEARTRDPALAADATLVCVGPLRQSGSLDGPSASDTLHCLRRTDGSTAFSLNMPEGGRVAGAPTLTRIRADGQVDVIESNATAITRTRISADGRSSQRTPLAEIATTPLAAAIDAQDRAAFLVPAPAGTELVIVESSGNVRRQALGLPVVLAAPALRLLADGCVLLHAEHADAAALYRYGADGVERWRYALALSTREAAADRGRVLIDAGADRVLVAEQPLDARPRTSTVTVLELATGARVWRDERVRQFGNGIAAVALDPVRALAIVAHERSGQTVLTAHALSDGRVVAQQRVECADAIECRPRDLRIAAGGVRLVAERYDARTGAQVQAANAEVAVPQPLATAAQAGLNGTWFARDSEGQGLVLEYAPDQDVLIGGWFTYAPDGAHASRDQRWYSLQGRVASGTQTAELTVFAGSGGAFASAAPAAQQQAVGTATLRLIDCGTAVLDYRFDAGNAQLAGEMPLVRLTTPQFACTDASGTQLPTPAASSVAGIELGQWGTWFDPSAPGQGLTFDLRPPSGGDPGLLIGGWFTYDVAGSEDDPQRQHWFTLQGDFAAARDGVVTVPLFRTIGGGFDRGATRNTVRVGTATLRFAGCERATLDYAFDDSDVAGPFAARTGSVPLAKLTGCAR